MHRDNNKLMELAELQLRAMEMEPSGGERKNGDAGFSLRAPLYMIFRHKWKVLACFVLGAVATIYYVANQPRMYVSEARLLIRSDRNGVAVDPMAGGNSLLQSTSYSDSQNTEFGILTSTHVAQEVVRRLGVDYILAHPTPQHAAAAADTEKTGRLHEAKQWLKGKLQVLHITQAEQDPEATAVQKVLHSITASRFREGSVMLVTCTDTNPHRAQIMLNALLDVYMAEHIEMNKSQVSPEYFKSKAAEWKVLFDKKGEELQELYRKLNITSIDEEKARLTETQAQLHNQLGAVEVAENANQARMQQVEQLLRNQPATEASAAVAVQTDDAMVGKLRDRLVELQMRKAQLAADFTDRAPQMQDVLAQIKQAQTMLQQAISGQAKIRPLSPLPNNDGKMTRKQQYEAMLLEQHANAASRQALQVQILAANKSLDELLAKEQQVTALKVQVKALEQQYMAYLNSNQVTEITQTLDQDRISNVRVEQTATLPFPSSDAQRKMLALLVFGCLASLGIGIGIAIVLEMLDQSIKTAEDVERVLGMEHLISIPAGAGTRPQPRGLIA